MKVGYKAMSMFDYREYLGNANITFTTNKSLRFKGINYNVIKSKTLSDGSLWYCGIATRHNGKNNIMLTITAIIHTNGIQTAITGKHLTD